MTIMKLVCGYRNEGCEFELETNLDTTDGLQPTDQCPYCIEYNEKNAEKLPIGLLLVADFEIEKE